MKKLTIGKKTSIAAAVVAVALLGGCNKEAAKEESKAEAPIELNTLEDKITYMVGFNMASQAKATGVEIDPRIVEMAINDFISGAGSKIPKEQQHDLMVEFGKKQEEKRQAQMKVREAERKEQGEKNKTEGAAYLVENAKKEGVKTTESGLQYKVVSEGPEDGKTPTSTDQVKVHYHGTLIDGEVFDSSKNRGTPATFGVDRVIKGWTEGLQLMSEGDKFEFYIPADLAYGEAGGGPIGPNATLVFEVELIEVNPETTAPANPHGNPHANNPHNPH